MSEKNSLWKVRAYALLAFVVYRAILWAGYAQTAIPWSPLGDPIVYTNLGKIFAAGESWPIEVVFRSPLYTYIVGWSFKIFGVSVIPMILLQNIVGLLASMLLLEVLLHYGGRGKSLFWTGLILLVQAGVWSTYEWKLFPVSLATGIQILLVYVFWLAWRADSERRKTLLLTLVGVLTGLVIVLRPNFMLFLPMLVLLGAWLVKKSQMSLAVLASWIILPLVMMAPFMIRNHSMGAGYSLAASSGVTFYHGNNPRAVGGYAAVPEVSPDVLFQNKDVLHVAAQNGATTAKQANKFWMNKGFEFLKENPLASAELVLRKFVMFLGPWEVGGDLPFKFEKLRVPFLRFLSLANFSILLLFGVLGFREFWRRDRESALLVGGLFLTTLATCLIFYTNNRYRIPAWPLLLIPAALGLRQLLEAVKKPWAREDEGIRFKTTGALLAGLILFILPIPINLTVGELLPGWHNWAVMNANAGNIPEAVGSYLKVLKYDETHRPSLSNLSRLELTVGNLDKSEFLSTKLVQNYPDSYVGWTNLSEISMKRQKLEPAKKFAEQALKHRPQFLPAQVQLAKSKFLLEEYESSCPMLEDLVGRSRDPILKAFLDSCEFVFKK